MSLVSDSIGNFIGGVSQQPDKMMFANQSKKLENFLLNPSVGLVKRPPTEHIAKLNSSTPTNIPYCHTVIKEDEKYQVIVDGLGGLKVYDLEGNEKTVTRLNYSANAVIKYLQSSNPREDFKLTTIGDYTFILNKKIKVTSTSVKSYSTWSANYLRSERVLIFLKQVNYGSVYTLYERVGSGSRAVLARYTVPNAKQSTSQSTTQTTEGSGSNSTSSSSTTGTTTDNKSELNTGTVITSLANAIKAKHSDWTVSTLGACLYINMGSLSSPTKPTDANVVTIESTDSNGDRDLFVFQNEADSIDKLPLTAPDYFLLKVKGSTNNTEDDYYVRFKARRRNSSINLTDLQEGYWEESYLEDVDGGFQHTTMPHVLKRKADGTFELSSYQDYGKRTCGDNDSNPAPSFVGRTIQDVFSHKGRLGFLSGDKTIFSDTEDIFNFYRTTVRTVLDTDPIDVGSNAKMANLKHFIPLAEEAFIFSEKSAFAIKGGDIFSNKTVSVDLAMEYPCSTLCSPVNVGHSAFFIYPNGLYSKLMEIYVTQNGTFDAREVTDHVPSYIPSDIYKMCPSVANNLLCLLSKTNKDKVYVYNFFYNQSQKVQSAWNIWTFKNGEVLNLDFDENFAYLTVKYSDGIYSEKMNLANGLTESGLDFQVFLDRKTQVQGTVADGFTTITKPYKNVNDLVVVSSNGFLQTIEEETDTTLKIKGEHSNLIIGSAYDSVWTQSRLYVREQQTNGSYKVKEGVLQLRDINLSYANTGYFTVKIKPKFTTQTTATYVFTGIIEGTSSATLGKVPISSGSFLIPVISNNEYVDIEIENNSYLPCCFLGEEWLGEFISRGR